MLAVFVFGEPVPRAARPRFRADLDGAGDLRGDGVWRARKTATHARRPPQNNSLTALHIYARSARFYALQRNGCRDSSIRRARAAILRIIRESTVHNQDELVKLLRKQGSMRRSRASAATCASSASPRPATVTSCPAATARPTGILSPRLRASSGGRTGGPSLTVVKTTTGTAQSVAVAIDGSSGPRSSARSPATTRSSSPPKTAASNASSRPRAPARIFGILP